MSVINKIKGGLIVSCQALEGEPLKGSDIMAKMAQAASTGGAVGIRANSPQDIRAIKEKVDLPVLGIYKNTEYDSEVYITPTIKEARKILEAGADIIAFDATNRLRPMKKSLKDYVKELKTLGVPLMADVSTLNEGISAEKLGVDLVSTTLSGYTEYTSDVTGVDFQLLKGLLNKLSIPVILEGRVSKISEVKKAINLGAHAIVVGSAITRPRLITKKFVNAIKEIN